MELSLKQLKILVPFKFEIIRLEFRAKITEIPKDTYFWETENGSLDGYTGFLQGFGSKMIGRLVVIYLGKEGSYTMRDFEHKDHICYCPAIYKQLSGKNKENTFYFSFYEAWRKYYNSFEDFKNSTDKRVFLPSYLPNYTR